MKTGYKSMFALCNPGNILAQMRACITSLVAEYGGDVQTIVVEEGTVKKHTYIEKDIPVIEIGFLYQSVPVSGICRIENSIDMTLKVPDTAKNIAAKVQKRMQTFFAALPKAA